MRYLNKLNNENFKAAKNLLHVPKVSLLDNSFNVIFENAIENLIVVFLQNNLIGSILSNQFSSASSALSQLGLNNNELPIDTLDEILPSNITINSKTPEKYSLIGYNFGYIFQIFYDAIHNISDDDFLDNLNLTIEKLFNNFNGNSDSSDNQLSQLLNAGSLIQLISNIITDIKSTKKTRGIINSAINYDGDNYEETIKVDKIIQSLISGFINPIIKNIYDYIFNSDNSIIPQGILSYYINLPIIIGEFANLYNYTYNALLYTTSEVENLYVLYNIGNMSEDERHSFWVNHKNGAKPDNKLLEILSSDYLQYLYSNIHDYASLVNKHNIGDIITVKKLYFSKVEVEVEDEYGCYTDYKTQLNETTENITITSADKFNANFYFKLAPYNMLNEDITSESSDDEIITNVFALAFFIKDNINLISSIDRNDYENIWNFSGIEDYSLATIADIFFMILAYNDTNYITEILNNLGVNDEDMLENLTDINIYKQVVSATTFNEYWNYLFAEINGNDSITFNPQTLAAIDYRLIDDYVNRLDKEQNFYDKYSSVYVKRNGYNESTSVDRDNIIMLLNKSYDIYDEINLSYISMSKYDYNIFYNYSTGESYVKNKVDIEIEHYQDGNNYFIIIHLSKSVIITLKINDYYENLDDNVLLLYVETNNSTGTSDVIVGLINCYLISGNLYAGNAKFIYQIGDILATIDCENNTAKFVNLLSAQLNSTKYLSSFPIYLRKDLNGLLDEINNNWRFLYEIIDLLIAITTDNSIEYGSIRLIIESFILLTDKYLGPYIKVVKQILNAMLGVYHNAVIKNYEADNTNIEYLIVGVKGKKSNVGSLINNMFMSTSSIPGYDMLKYFIKNYVNDLYDIDGEYKNTHMIAYMNQTEPLPAGSYNDGYNWYDENGNIINIENEHTPERLYIESQHSNINQYSNIEYTSISADKTDKQIAVIVALLITSNFIFCTEGSIDEFDGVRAIHDKELINYSYIQTFISDDTFTNIDGIYCCDNGRGISFKLSDYYERNAYYISILAYKKLTQYDISAIIHIGDNHSKLYALVSGKIIKWDEVNKQYIIAINFNSKYEAPIANTQIIFELDKSAVEPNINCTFNDAYFITDIQEVLEFNSTDNILNDVISFFKNDNNKLILSLILKIFSNNTQFYIEDILKYIKTYGDNISENDIVYYLRLDNETNDLYFGKSKLCDLGKITLSANYNYVSSLTINFGSANDMSIPFIHIYGYNIPNSLSYKYDYKKFPNVVLNSSLQITSNAISRKHSAYTDLGDENSLLYDIYKNVDNISIQTQFKGDKKYSTSILTTNEYGEEEIQNVETNIYGLYYTFDVSILNSSTLFDFTEDDVVTNKMFVNNLELQNILLTSDDLYKNPDAYTLKYIISPKVNGNISFSRLLSDITVPHAEINGLSDTGANIISLLELGFNAILHADSNEIYIKYCINVNGTIYTLYTDTYSPADKISVDAGKLLSAFLEKYPELYSKYVLTNTYHLDSDHTYSEEDIERIAVSELFSGIIYCDYEEQTIKTMMLYYIFNKHQITKTILDVVEFDSDVKINIKTPGELGITVPLRYKFNGYKDINGNVITEINNDSENPIVNLYAILDDNTDVSLYKFLKYESNNLNTYPIAVRDNEFRDSGIYTQEDLIEIQLYAESEYVKNIGYDDPRYIIFKPAVNEETGKTEVDEITGEVIYYEDIQKYENNLDIYMPPYNLHELRKQSCVKFDTSILMADGSYKLIKDVIVGDKVIGRNNIINTVYYGPIKLSDSGMPGYIRYTFNDGKFLDVVGDHRIYDSNSNKFIYISELNNLETNYIEEPLIAYELYTTGDNTYYANGILCGKAWSNWPTPIRNLTNKLYKSLYLNNSTNNCISYLHKLLSKYILKHKSPIINEYI